MDSSHKVISDPVAEWLRNEPHESKEFILELDRPQRTVELRFDDRRQRVFSDMSITGAASAEVSEKDTSERIYEITNRVPTVLKSARAIAFLANARELNEIAALPGVKTIRFNRRFGSQ